MLVMLARSGGELYPRIRDFLLYHNSYLIDNFGRMDMAIESVVFFHLSC